MTDERVLCCQRVADWEPNVQSVVDQCATCGAAIWVALSSPQRDRKMCMQCAFAEFGDSLKGEPPTKRQLADIRRSRR